MKGKLLIVAASFRGGGAERLSVEFANCAEKMGYEVTYYVSSLEGPYRNELSTNVHLINGMSKKFSFGVFKIANIIKRNKFDFVFCSQEYIVSIVYFSRLISGSKPLLVAREASTPSVNIKVNGFLGRIKKYIYYKVYAGVDKLIAPTISVAQDLTQFYGLERHVNIIPNPIDKSLLLSKANKPCEFSFDKNKKYIIVVGRLIISKGVDTVLKSFAKIKSNRNIDLIILGEGVELNNLKNLSIELGINSNVHFLGFVENPFPFIKKSDIFISASEYEGMPNSLIQAVSLNVTCISTLSTSIIKDYVDDSLIFDFNNIQQLSDCIKSVLSGEVQSNDYLPYKFLEPSEFVVEVLGTSDDK